MKGFKATSFIILIEQILYLKTLLAIDMKIALLL